MALAGAAVYAVQAARIDDRIAEDISQEVEEFARFQRTGIDPETGEQFPSMARLFEVALQRNVPDEHQAILAFIDGRVAFYSATRDASGLVDDRALRRAVEARLDSARPTSTFGEVGTARGPVRFAVLPVSAGDQRGAWVVTYLVEGEEAEFTDVLRTYVPHGARWPCSPSAIAAGSSTGRAARPCPRSLRRDRAGHHRDRPHPARSRSAGTTTCPHSDAHVQRDARPPGEGVHRASGQFLDDVGHELRTPITVVRGHLELLDSFGPPGRRRGHARWCSTS